MTTVIIAKGSSFTGFPMAIRSPVQESHLKYYGLFGDTLAHSLRNLKLGSAADAVAIGAPTVNANSLEIGNLIGIDTGVAETANMTIFVAAAFTRPVDTATRKVLASNYSSPAGLNFFATAPAGAGPESALSLGAGYDNGSGGTTQQTTVLGSTPGIVAGLYACVIESGVGRRIYDVTAGAAPSVSASATARKLNAAGTIRIGLDIGATGRLGTYLAYAGAIFDTPLTTLEVATFGAAMRTRLATRGITV